MARRPSSSSSPVVVYTAQAKADRRNIYRHNVDRWGEEQARAYRNFLTEVIRDLAKSPATAPLVENLPGVRSTIAMWPGARDGHRIFFRETENGIEVLYVMHTKMDWQGRLGV